MIKFIQELRDKPEKDRRKILIIASGVTAVVILLVWLIIIPKDYLKKENHGESQFSGLSGQVKDGFSGENLNELQKGLDGLKDIKDGNMQLDQINQSEENVPAPKTKNDVAKPKNRLPLEE